MLGGGQRATTFVLNNVIKRCRALLMLERFRPLVENLAGDVGDHSGVSGAPHTVE